MGVIGQKAGDKVRSGACNLERGITSGKQDFETDEKEWPVSQPILKLEARAQCSGKLFIDSVTEFQLKLIGYRLIGC